MTPIDVKLRVVMVPKGAEPFETDISTSLDGFQAALDGGYVQCVPLPAPWLGVTLWCDEEGRLKGLPRNRYVHEIAQWVHGPFFLAGGADMEGETLPVPPNRVAALLDRFQEWAE